MKNIFCARCQAITPHKAEVDMNGEFLFTCTTEGCDRFIKFPSDITKEGFIAKIDEHEEQNKGQVSLEVQEAKLKGLLDDAEPSVAETPKKS